MVIRISDEAGGDMWHGPKEGSKTDLERGGGSSGGALEGTGTSPGLAKEITLAGSLRGTPSMIQSTNGIKGNFEVVAPSVLRGLDYYWRNNDDPELPWYGPFRFAEDAGLMDAASLIQSNFADGNLEVAAVDAGGHNLLHFWRDSGPDFEWHGPAPISEPSTAPLFSGNPSMIQSTNGHRGNFDLVVPLAEGGLAHYWRDNDDPELPWYGPFQFGTVTGVVYDAVCLIQSNFGDPGNLEVVARANDSLVHFWRGPGPEFRWNGPFAHSTGAAGTPALIQSRYGRKGNFELVVPMATGGLAHYWRDNDDPHLPWYGPMTFATRLGKIDAVSMIQSNFGDPGSLELVAMVGGQLAFFWREPGLEARWKGPQFITF